MVNYGKTPLVRVSGDRLITTSLAVSQHFGKKHLHVLESIRNLDCSQEFSQSNFRSTSYQDGQGKPRPAYDITRDGFTFLCMGFTGSAAAVWKERYIAAFNEMERQLLGGGGEGLTPLRLDRIEGAVESMAMHMRDLVQVSHQQVKKLDVTARYISLLELNQTGRRRVTRRVGREVLALKAQGMPQAAIARLLRISTTAVSLLVNDKYPWNDSDAPDALDEMLDGEIQTTRALVIAKLKEV